MLVPPESSSAVLVMTRSKSVSICNHSRGRLVDSRNRTFSRGYPNLMRSYGGLLEHRGSNLNRWNLRLMPNISYAACPSLYLEWFRRNSHLKCVLQPKIAKNSLKSPILGVQGRSRSSMLVYTTVKLVSSTCYDEQQVCVYLQPFSCYRLVDSSRNRTFSTGYRNVMRSYGGLLEPRGSGLTPLISMFNAEYFICRLSWSMLNGSAQFILKMCIAAKNRWKFTKTHIFGVQGRSMSSMLVPLESSLSVLVIISSKSVSICNRFHARWANSGRITISKGYPSLMPSFEGNLLTHAPN